MTKNLVITDPNYPIIKNDSHAKQLPSGTTPLFGCQTCDWKSGSGKGLCPFNFASGRGFDAKKNRHPNRICNQRINWLLSFSRGNMERPSLTQFLLDFNKGLATIQSQQDFIKLKEAEEELAKVEKELLNLPQNDSKEAKEIKARYKILKSKKTELRQNWFQLWNQITGYEEKEEDRKTTKKLQVSEKPKLSISDIHEILRSKPVDAEFTVEHSKENENKTKGETDEKM